MQIAGTGGRIDEGFDDGKWVKEVVGSGFGTLGCCAMPSDEVHTCARMKAADWVIREELAWREEDVTPLMAMLAI